MELVTGDRLAEAASTLAHAMLDEPGGRWMLPDPDEFVDVNEPILARTMTHALDKGRVDVSGDPFVGVAIWLEFPAVGNETQLKPSSAAQPTVPEHAVDRIEAFSNLLRLMRRRARPDHHVYLDTIGVLPDHRRQGVATRLLEAGFGWADRRGLPCSLDTLDPDNMGFYRRRGFEVVSSEPLGDSDLTFTSMRRPPGA